MVDYLRVDCCHVLFVVECAGTVTIKSPSSKPVPTYVIPDSREGWVESVRLAIEGYLCGKSIPSYDYNLIRPAGSLIAVRCLCANIYMCTLSWLTDVIDVCWGPMQGFGGVATGPGPLKRLHGEIHTLFTPLIGKPITVTAIVDLMNLIGRCVVSGNQRQTAEIAFGDPTSFEYINLKDYSVNPHRAEYGWTR